MRLLVFCFILVTSFSVTKSVSAFNQNTTYNAKQIKADLRQVQRLLRSVHPNLYAHRSPKKIKRMFRQLEENIQPFMSAGAVATLVQQTLAVACDEHTSIDIWDDLKRVPGDLDLYYQPLTLTADRIIETKHLKPESSPQISSLGHLGTVRSDQETARFFRSIMAADGCPGSVLPVLPEPVCSSSVPRVRGPGRAPGDRAVFLRRPSLHETG